jgi:hypothetical protein
MKGFIHPFILILKNTSKILIILINPTHPNSKKNGTTPRVKKLF